MKILLSGASGFIGSHIAEALHAGGHEVVAVTRANGVDFMRMQAVDDWLCLLAGIDVVINSVGIITETRGQTFEAVHHHAPAALFQACVHRGIKRVIQISALGADACAVTPYQLTKKAADDVLRSLALEWFVLRPSLVFGPGGKSTVLFQRLARLPVIPLPGRGTQRIQPVHVDDLVAAVMLCLTATQVQRTIDVVGPRAMTFAEWLQRLRIHSGRAMGLTFSIPDVLLMALSQLLRHAFPLLQPDNLRMLQLGNTADVHPLAQLLGRMPRDLP